MITPRFFIEAAPEAGTPFALPKAVAHHATRVLRLRLGDALALFNGHGGEYHARITDIGRDAVTVRIDAYTPVEREASLAITLMQGVAHGERMDSMVQKATELGVACIVPVVCERSVTRLDGERALTRVAHWRNVAIAACEQCGRNRVPDIGALITLESALTRDTLGARLMLSPRAASSLRSLAQPANGATLLVGPEGGLTDAEENLATTAGFASIRFGPRVLRTETAGPAFIAALLALHGDW